MTINFEVKKDGLRQTQDGIWKLTLTVLPEDMPVELMQAPMGTPYALAMVKIDYDNPVGANNAQTGKTEGEKLRERACIRCQEDSYVMFVNERFNTPYDLSVRDIQARAKIAAKYIYMFCGIESRKELTINKQAQEKFRELDRQYKEWLNPIDELYKDNLERLK